MAGKRDGLDGSRSSLFYEAVRIIKEMRCATDGRYPRYIVWENVPGAFSSNKGEDFRCVLESICRVKDGELSVPRPAKWPYAGEILGDGFSLAWRQLNACGWGIPQRRKRIFLVADFAGGSAGKILFESEGLSRYTPQGFRAWEETAGGSSESFGETGCRSVDGYNGAVDDVAATLGVNCGMSTGRNGMLVLNDQGGNRMDVTEDETCTLRAEAHHPPVVMDDAFAVENYPTDGRCKIQEDGRVQTLTSRMGTGGNNTASGEMLLTRGKMLFTNRLLKKSFSQRSYYTNYINSHPDWVLVEVYPDEGISGLSTKKRENFQRMIGDALDGKIDLIITKSISRFARNTVDTLTAIRQLKEKGIEVYFEKENIWTLDGKSELLLTIMSSLAQEESRSISENVTWGQRRRFEQGKVSLPYKNFLGYDRGETKDAPPVINPEQAVLVRRIYNLFLHGKTTGAIARLFTEEGIPTPAGKTEWRARTVESILTNEKYRGSARLQKRFTVDFLTKTTKVNEGEVQQYYIEESHEAIIPPEQWDAVQDEVNRRKELGKAYSGKSVLSTKIVCGDCGGLYGLKTWHSTDKYKTVVWQCLSKFDKSKPQCRTPHVSEEEVKERFIKVYNGMIEDRAAVITACRVAKERFVNCPELQAEAEELLGEINEITILTQQCITEKQSGQAQGDFTAKYNGYVDRYEKVKKRYDEITGQLEARAVKGRAIGRLLRDISKRTEPLTEFDEMLWLTVINKVTVQSDGTLVFRFHDGREIEG